MSALRLAEELCDGRMAAKEFICEYAKESATAMHLGREAFVAIGMLWRSEVGQLSRNLLSGTAGSEYGACFAERRASQASTLAILRKMAARGALSVSLRQLVINHMHMHLNRVFVSEQRRQEALLMQLLLRHVSSPAWVATESGLKGA